MGFLPLLNCLCSFAVLVLFYAVARLFLLFKTFEIFRHFFPILLSYCVFCCPCRLVPISTIAVNYLDIG